MNTPSDSALAQAFREIKARRLPSYFTAVDCVDAVEDRAAEIDASRGGADGMTMTPRELAKRIERGEKWTLAQPAAASDSRGGADEIYIDFPQVGTAGPFQIVGGIIQLPDETMNDLIRHARTGYAPQPAAAGGPVPLDPSLHERVNVLRGKAAQHAAAGELPEAVAEIGAVYTLLWAGDETVAAIVNRHGLKVGDKLYASAAVAECRRDAEPAGWISDNDLFKLQSSIDEARNIRMSSKRTHLRVHPIYIPAIAAMQEAGR